MAVPACRGTEVSHPTRRPGAPPDGSSMRPAPGRRGRSERRPDAAVPVVDARPEMTRPVRCPHFGPCGGCDHLDLYYREELRRKQDALGRLLGASSLSGFQLLPVLPAARPLFYRTAVKVPFGTSEKAGVTAGFFRPGTHRIVNLQECAVQHPQLTALIRAVRSLAAQHRVPIYQEYLHRGLLRHLVARVAPGTEEILAGLVVRRAGAPQVRRLADELFERFRDRGLVGVVENVNPQQTNAVLGARTRRLVGRPFLVERADGLEVRTSLASFVQVNPEQASVLYGTVLDLLGDVQGRRIVEAYAGYGPIALRLAKQGARVLAVEQNQEAVRDGIRAARENGLDARITFRADDAARALPRIGGPLDAVVVDPPRRGLAEPVIDVLARSAVPRVVYVSCNPVSLVRDLEALSSSYAVRVLRPIDLFPRTGHLEIVALLERED